MIGVLVGSISLLLIVAVHDTERSFRGQISRRTEHWARSLCLRRRSAYPTVLYIATACFCNTGTGEGTCHTEVIDIAAELLEQ